MGKDDFPKQEAISALISLGFTKDTCKRRSPHDKYSAPREYQNSTIRSFIMIPHGRKLKCQRAILKQLRILGGEKLENSFLEELNIKPSIDK